MPECAYLAILLPVKQWDNSYWQTKEAFSGILVPRITCNSEYMLNIPTTKCEDGCFNSLRKALVWVSMSHTLKRTPLISCNTERLKSDRKMKLMTTKKNPYKQTWYEIFHEFFHQQSHWGEWLSTIFFLFFIILQLHKNVVTAYLFLYGCMLEQRWI